MRLVGISRMLCLVNSFLTDGIKKLVHCCNVTTINLISIPQAVSVECHLLDISEHPNKTLDCLAINVIFNYEFCYKHGQLLPQCPMMVTMMIDQ